MTIGIDIRVLAQGAFTGVEEYTEGILRHLPRVSGTNYKLFYNAYRAADLKSVWTERDDFEICRRHFPNRLFFLTARMFNWPKIDEALGGVDVLWTPHFFPAPAGKHTKKVITFHDLSFERYPEFFSFKKKRWHNFFIDARRQARAADRLIAVSDSTKNDLVDIYGIPEEKITVIFSGVDEFLGPVSSSQELTRVKARYSLPDRFVLFIGTLEPRKNITGVIKSFDVLKRDSRFDNLKLVVAFAPGWNYGSIIQAAYDSPYASDIIFTGRVARSDMAAFYALAEVFLYPSFFEGFGFQALEAMRCGTPVVTSRVSSLPELAGEAALLVDPYNPEAIAEAVRLFLTDDNLREEYRKRGFEREKKFSWEKAAKKTYEVLNF